MVSKACFPSPHLYSVSCNVQILQDSVPLSILRCQLFRLAANETVETTTNEEALRVSLQLDIAAGSSIGTP